MKPASFLAALVVVIGCGGVRAPKPKRTATQRWTRTPPPMPTTSSRRPKAPRTTERTLPNGLRVVVVEQRRRPIVSIRAVFSHGAAQDVGNAAGATYFAVSLLGGFYEVDANDRPIVEADSFARKVLFTGAQFMTDVTADHAYVGIDGYAKDTATYLKMLSRAIRKPRCGPTSFALRRNSVIHALEEVELSDEGVFAIFLNRAAFGEGHPYARPLFGSMSTLKEISLRDVVLRQEALLTPVGTTLLIVGDVDPGLTLGMVESTFGRWVRRKPKGLRRLRAPTVPRRQQSLLVPRAPAASMILCAARPLTDVRADDATLEVLSRILGDSLDSRLGTGLRMTAGLSYSFTATLLERRHGRALVACTQVRARDTEPALEIFQRELAKLAAAPPTPKELARAKRQIVTAHGVSLRLDGGHHHHVAQGPRTRSGPPGPARCGRDGYRRGRARRGPTGPRYESPPFPSRGVGQSRDRRRRRHRTRRPSPRSIEPMNAAKTVHLVRHAESEANVWTPPVIGGRCSWAELTPRGLRQSQALGERLRREAVIIDQAAASTAVRAQQTARHCLDRIDRSPYGVLTYPELEELDQGEWSGRPREDIYTPEQIEIIERTQWVFRPPGGESQQDVFERGARWLRTHVVESDFEQTWVFTHGVVIKATITGLLGLDRTVAWRIPIDNTSITSLRYEGGEWTELRRNDTAHRVD